MIITNTSDISLDLAVWLLHDEYDYVTGVENYISATTLMKPTRQIILINRLEDDDTPVDVDTYIARAMGRALHDSMERAWTHGYVRSLKLLGYPQNLIDRVRINPTDEEVRASNEIIPVYLEHRMFAKHNGFTIGGKFDMVAEGSVRDNKSTSAYTWLYGNKDSDKDDDYKLQMSLYRWLDSKQPLRKITEDYGQINFIFTDWQKMQAKTNPDYPQKRVEHKQIELMSLKETEEWVNWKLAEITKGRQTESSKLPDCTDKELWISAPSYKYYADSTKTDGRSTKNFDSLSDANAYMVGKAGKGILKTIRSEPKRCGYCDAFPICSQKDRYFKS